MAQQPIRSQAQRYEPAPDIQELFTAKPAHNMASGIFSAHGSIIQTQRPRNRRKTHRSLRKDVPTIAVQPEYHAA